MPDALRLSGLHLNVLSFWLKRGILKTDASMQACHPDQQDLFNEAEAIAEEIPDEEADDPLSAPS